MSKPKKEEEVVEKINEQPQEPKKEEEVVEKIVTTSLEYSSYEQSVNKNTCKILISYPDNYKGVRYFDNNKEYDVADDAAIEFVNKGIAQIVK